MAILDPLDEGMFVADVGFHDKAEVIICNGGFLQNSTVSVRDITHNRYNIRFNGVSLIISIALKITKDLTRPLPLRPPSPSNSNTQHQTSTCGFVSAYPWGRSVAERVQYHKLTIMNRVVRSAHQAFHL